MAGTIQCGRRVRKDFGKIPSTVKIPNLIEIQRQSYEQFLQKDMAPDSRKEAGPPGGLQVGVSHRRLQRQRRARVRQLPLRRSEVHGGGVPRPRHDLRHPAQGDAPPRGVRPRQGGEDAHHAGAARPGSVPGRAAADDGEGHLHHQRDGARGGVPAPALRRRVLRRRQGQDRRLRASSCTRRGSFPTAARGWSSSSTPTTCCTCGSTAGGRCRPPRSCAPSGSSSAAATSPRTSSATRRSWPCSTSSRRCSSFEDRMAWVKLTPEAHAGIKVADDIKPPRHKEPLVQGGKTLNAKLIEKLKEAGIDKIPVRAESLVGRRTASRVVDSETGEVLVEANAELTSTLLDPGGRPQGGALQAAGGDPGQGGRLHLRHARARTTPRTPTRRWWRSTAGCGRATRPRWTRRGRSSAACSWTRGATTSRGSAAS